MWYYYLLLLLSSPFQTTSAFHPTIIHHLPSQFTPPSLSSTIPLHSSTTNNNDLPLTNCVCIITGASRGIGKGIAIEFGKQGAIVYVTGTSSSSTTSSSSLYTTNPDVGGIGTIEQTAQSITDAGGTGIPVACDHSDDDQVRRLFSKVQSEQGRLDVLINNAFRVPGGGAKGLLEGNFWDQGSDVWDAMHTVGLRSHYIASCCAIPIMMQNPPSEQTIPRPFIGMVSSFGGLIYTFNVAYGVGKAGVDRLAKDMAVELRPQNICVCSFWPGVVLTERMQLMLDNGEWEETVGIPVENAESPQFTGKAMVAVAMDRDNLEKTGTVQIVAEVATEYGFADENGRQPPSIRSLKFLLPGYAFDERLNKIVKDWMIPDWRVPLWIMAGGRPDRDAKV